MRIAIDARELAGQPTGVGRFLGEILREWAAMPEAAAHEFVLCAPAALHAPFIAPPTGDSGSALQQPRMETVIAPGRGTSWEQRVLPRLAERARADVLFCPAYSGPVRGRIPLVVAIHDVSFAAHPEWFRWREGLRRRIITRRAAARASRIITISEFSRGEIVDHLGVAAAKIEVIYPGVTRHVPAARAAERAQLAGETPPPADPLVLYVGSIFNRRHLPETIRGFTHLVRRHPGARLAIVGDNRSFPRIDLNALLARTKRGDAVSLMPYVEEAQLAELYGRARAFVFLSEYEGFGLTPAEALAAGVPIVVLDTPVAREVYQEAAVYVTRPDPHVIDPALEQVLFNEETRARVLQAAPTVLARYSWHTCARRVLEVLTA